MDTRDTSLVLWMSSLACPQPYYPGRCQATMGSRFGLARMCIFLQLPHLLCGGAVFRFAQKERWVECSLCHANKTEYAKQLSADAWNMCIEVVTVRMRKALVTPRGCCNVDKVGFFAIEFSQPSVSWSFSPSVSSFTGSIVRLAFPFLGCSLEFLLFFFLLEVFVETGGNLILEGPGPMSFASQAVCGSSVVTWFVVVSACSCAIDDSLGCWLGSTGPIFTLLLDSSTDKSLAFRTDELLATTVGVVLFADEACNEEGQNIKEVLRFDQISLFLWNARRISELHKQWNMKMKRPCNELQRAKRYWKTIVWLPRAKTPNIHVIPSKGNKTVIDFRPDLIRSNFVALDTPLVWILIISLITNPRITVFIRIINNAGTTNA